jgi:UDP-glucose 4-epimerase
LDNLHRGRREELSNNAAEIRFLQVDVQDVNALYASLNGIDLVYHLAAQSSVISATKDAKYTFNTNVAGTFNVLQAAKINRVKRVVFTSSREVYGDPPQVPVPETAPIKPKNSYGASKAAGEAYCGVFGSEGLETAVLRLANVYGPGDTDRVLPIFVENALRARPLVLYGGQQVIDFVWIDTVVAALLRVGLGEQIPEPLNVGSGHGTTVADLSQRVLEMTDSRSPVEIAPDRKIEVSRFVADVSRAQQIINLKPPRDPLFGLPAVVEWTRQQILTERCAGELVQTASTS